MFAFFSNIIPFSVNNNSARKKPKEISDDADLITRIKCGDRKAFDELVDRHKKRAFFTAIGLVGERELAYDLTQDAWVCVFRAMPRFEEGKPFYPWFHRILTNLCKNALRHNSVENRVISGSIDDEDMPQIEENIFAPESLVEQREAKMAVWSAIKRLQPEHRELIVLVHFESRSYQEASELLDLPIGTVMSRLYYARKKLAGMLSEFSDYDD